MFLLFHLKLKVFRIMQLKIQIVLFSLIALLHGQEVSIAEDVPDSRVLVIGIDGIRRDALLAAKTPNLDRLIKEGAFAENTQILGERYSKNDTVSGPGWSSFLTGVWADKHGVNDNSFKGKNYEDYPHFFARIKGQFPDAKTASFVDWEPIDSQIVSHADIRKVYPAHGADDYVKKDKTIAADTITLLKEDHPHAVFLILAQSMKLDTAMDSILLLNNTSRQSNESTLTSEDSSQRWSRDLISKMKTGWF